jgi:2-phospho-L-lactate guanylyltransferase
MQVTAVVPVNHLDEAKSRLAQVLPDRRCLVLEMLGRVVNALQPHDVLVVSPDPRLAEEAHKLGASFLLQHGTGLNEAVQQAREHVRKTPLLIALGDLPQLTRADIKQLLERTEDVVLAPDKQQNGTNLMLLRTQDFTFEYGPQSFTKHFTQALMRGLTIGVHRSAGTELDVDSPSDLPQLAWTSCD